MANNLKVDYSKESDLALVRRIEKGDDAAETVLLERFIPILGHYIRKKIDIASSDSEDVVQETVIALIRNLRSGKFDETKCGGKVGSYIFGIAKTQIRQYYKKRSRQTGREASIPSDEDLSRAVGLEKNSIETLLAESRLEAAAWLRIVKRCAKRLPLIHRVVYHLREFEGQKMKEIGEMLDLNEQQVIDKYRHARERINVCVRNQLKQGKE